MGKIQILSDHLTNQIAAGEVVERPASVVKELIENAIDSEATRIVIRIKEGGISSIQVSDNGRGMDQEDALLAFSRHATSKLKKERDLFSIRTLGFRGEALPSIASIARVTLSTAYSSDQAGVRLKIAGNEQPSIEPIYRPRGTDVVVEDLFYNTPARLKYLKTMNTEIGHIADVVGRIAIAHPEIAFSLFHQNRELLRTSGDGKLKHVLHAIYGRQVSRFLLPLKDENLDFELDGYVTKPEVTRSSRSYMTLILNGRYIRSLPLTQSILQAYGTLLPTGRHPIVALRIWMDPKLVDVNVHPTKLEVRLSKERECCQLIEESIKALFRKQTLIPEVDAQTVLERKGSQAHFTFPKPSTSIIREELDKWNPTEERRQTPDPLDGEMMSEEPEPERIEESPEPFPSSVITEGLGLPENDAVPKTFPMLSPLAQIHGTYIVAQSEDGFYLIDQHAAHERVYYETFMQRLSQKNTRQQLLIVPLTIECTIAEAKLLQRYIDCLKKWGLEIEPFGGSTFLVRSYPSWIPEESAKDLIDEIIEWLRKHGSVNTSLLRDATAKMMACKAAIKANRHLRQDEMESLIAQLAQCSNPFTCPHGRPITVHFSTYELEKMFKRVM